MLEKLEEASQVNDGTRVEGGEVSDEEEDDDDELFDYEKILNTGVNYLKASTFIKCTSVRMIEWSSK